MSQKNDPFLIYLKFIKQDIRLSKRKTKKEVEVLKSYAKILAKGFQHN